MEGRRSKDIQPADENIRPMQKDGTKQKQNKAFKVNSKVEVFSETQKKWHKGTVIKKYNSHDGEWLVVKYDHECRGKEIQYGSPYIRSLQKADELENGDREGVTVKYNDMRPMASVHSWRDSDKSNDLQTGNDALKHPLVARDDDVAKMRLLSHILQRDFGELYDKYAAALQADKPSINHPAIVELAAECMLIQEQLTMERNENEKLARTLNAYTLQLNKLRMENRNMLERDMTKDIEMATLKRH